MKKLRAAIAAALFLSLALGIVFGTSGGFFAPLTAKASFGIQIPVFPLLPDYQFATKPPLVIVTKPPTFITLVPPPRKTLNPDKTPEKQTPQPTRKPSTGSGSKVMNNEGPLFLSFQADLTKELLMFTPMDLSIDGEFRIPLIGNEDRVVGEAKVVVQSGMVIVSYLVVNGVKVDERNEFFTFFPDIRSVPSVQPRKLQEMKLKFNIPYNVTSWLNSDSKVLLYINTPVSYKTNLSGLTAFSFQDEAYLERMLALLPLMDLI